MLIFIFSSRSLLVLGIYQFIYIINKSYKMRICVAECVFVCLSSVGSPAINYIDETFKGASVGDWFSFIRNI